LKTRCPNGGRLKQRTGEKGPWEKGTNPPKGKKTSCQKPGGEKNRNRKKESATRSGEKKKLKMETGRETKETPLGGKQKKKKKDVKAGNFKRGGKWDFWEARGGGAGQMKRKRKETQKGGAHGALKQKGPQIKKKRWAPLFNKRKTEDE